MKPTTTLATSTTPDGSHLVLQTHDDQFFLKIDNVTLMSTVASLSEQEMAVLACGDMKTSGRVLIGGLGFGFTLAKVIDLVPKGTQVDVAELLSEIIEWNREHLQSVNGKLLGHPGVTIHQKDVLRLIQENPSTYHAILLDVDNSPDALVQNDNSSLYDRGGLQQVKAALTKKGRVVFWSANTDKAFEKRMEKVFRNVQSVPMKAYPKAKRPTHTLFIGER